MFLFGSRAREDHDSGSDTDLLIACDERQPRHVSIGKVSMFFYPWAKLLADAASGELFAGHIALEGKPIQDPLDQLGELRRTFKPRRTYAAEISHALDFGWFILRFPEALKPSLAAKRMVWCVRTILIARSAEAGRLIFAPAELGKSTSSTGAQELLLVRRRRRLTKPILGLFEGFLRDEGPAPGWYQAATLNEYLDRFTESANGVALKTLRQNDEFAVAPYP